MTECNTTLFWSKVDRSGECWEWLASKTHDGYGRHHYDGGTMAHRLAYELTRGPIPAGMCVCHACDNRGCVNPTHLWLGTQADNIKDMRVKGRGPRLEGERHGRAKLTASNVRDIRARHAEGVSARQLAREYGVAATTITRIFHGGWGTEV